MGPQADPAIVAHMTAAQRHRGPDGQGLWSAPGVALGHRRLKVLDLSDAGRQPMSTPDGRYTIVYNGEVYNYQELRYELSRYHFRSRTDTEVVLYAYVNWGPSCLDRFIGMYSFAIWDSVERQLFCARDRLGIKPFYYSERGEHFLFSSEIRPLLAAGIERTVNDAVLYDFLARDFYEHTNDTFFAAIHKLPPGTWVTVKEGKMSTPQRYWNLRAEVDAITPEADAQAREHRLIHLCKEAVRSHLQSDVPVGVALSGGLDSATLLALLDTTHPDPSRIEAFSFTFSDPAYSERPYVEALANHTGRNAHFVEISPQDFRLTAERLTLVQEEPFAGAPISAYTLCFERARAQGFIVIMDGSGIDEGLGGYDRFRPALWADLFVAGRWESLDRELVASGINTPARRKEAMTRMQHALLPQGDIGQGQDLTSSVRPDCLHGDFAGMASHPIPHFERCFDDTLHNLMYRELSYTKLPRALRFRDRLSMSAGTELRPPFLDHRLLAYEFALPSDDLISCGVSKSILRKAAMRLLPETVCLASKRSVQTPQREWFRNDLREWVRESIDCPSFWNRGWVDRQRGMKAMDAFFKGQGDNSFFLWQWLNLELWARQMLTPDAQSPDVTA